MSSTKPIPAKGEGVREQATAEARMLIAEGEMSIREIVGYLTTKYGIALGTAYQYRKEAERALAIETVDEQMTIGMLATHAAMRCAREGEDLARSMRDRAHNQRDRDAASAAYARAGRQYIAVAQAAIKLDVGEQMSDEDQAAIIGAAVAHNLDKLPRDLKRQMLEHLRADIEAVH